MKQILFILALIVTFSACEKKDDSQAVNELYGRYRGSFHRSGMDTADVSIFFKDNNSFEGSSAMPNYPALCRGSFHQGLNTLSVIDSCAWTANFDWSLIFNGDYNLRFTGENSVRLWRTTGAVTDEYLLNRIVR